jgi:uncharacterized protein
MSTKAVFPIAEFKAATDSPGEFTAVVSVFNNIDLQGDRVVPGAFKNSLAKWAASGDPIPVIWSHDWQDPFAHIGFVTNAAETAEGLQITGKNDLDKPFAKQVHDLLVSRRVTQMSFAYDVLAERPGKDRANELVELDLIEVGPTLRGANPSAQLVGAKALLDAAAAKERERLVPFDLSDIRESALAIAKRLESLGLEKLTTPAARLAAPKVHPSVTAMQEHIAALRAQV